jgi:Zn-dependent peptidase ImmA (M78 family)
MRRIYKHFGIRIDLWPYRLKNLRGAFFNDSCGPTVMLDKNLPDDPLIFTMCHELKHFLRDQDLPLSYCHGGNLNAPIEVGAEIFAAELIFPEDDFLNCMLERGIRRGSCKPSDLVYLKRETGTTLSYQGLTKRAEHFHFCAKGAFDGVKWKKLEEQIFGVPSYKRRLRGK